MRKVFALIPFLLFCHLAFAITGDSIHYLTHKDTIFLSIGEYNEKVFEHQIEKKQTLFSLRKFYGMSMEELIYYNPELALGLISVGQKVKIPIPNRAILRYKHKQFQGKDYVPVCYIVKKGDNLFRISKQHFRMPMDSVVARNNLISTNLKAGQVLQVGWMSIYGIAENLRTPKILTPEEQRSLELKKKYLRRGYRKREYNETGVAYWQKNNRNASGDLYALHRRAPINSIVSVTNPMTRKIAYVKVIGRLPDTAYGRDVVVVLSPKAARLLGAKDSRFFVKLKFVK